MSDAAVKDIIKAIKEGISNLSPVAEQFIKQVQYNGYISIFIGVLSLLLVFITYLVVKSTLKKDYSKDDYNSKELSGVGVFVLVGGSIVAVIFAIIGLGSLYDGLSQVVSPLYFLIK